jgi:homoserine dehydrogenase
MREIRLLLVGFGNVGDAFLQLLQRKQKTLRKDYALKVLVTGVCTGTHGGALDPGGLDLEQLLQTKRNQSQLNGLSVEVIPQDTLSFINACEADIMLEISPVSYSDGQPAIRFIHEGLSKGMHVITANKGPIVHAYHELRALAREVQRAFLFESTVMDGAPILSMWRETLPAAHLTSFRGILNSTTNFILNEMESSVSFDAAVQKAQERGIAETDPTGDLEGWDAAIKVGVLSTVLMGTPLLPNEVERKGIMGLSQTQITDALASGKRWKLICMAEREGAKVRGVVKPIQVTSSDPLFHVSGTSSAVTFHTDVLGPLTVLEENPGPDTTAYGMLADLLNSL